MTPDELRAVAERATPGPWSVLAIEGHFEGSYRHYLEGPPADGWVAPSEFGFQPEDAIFIATCDPSLVSKLIDLWEAIREDNTTVIESDATVQALHALEAEQPKSPVPGEIQIELKVW